MAMWSVVSVTPSIRDRNDVYGHYFAVEFRLKYAPSLVGSFTEMPRLEWNETITMIERDAGSPPPFTWVPGSPTFFTAGTSGTWWQYVGDQYARNPGSPTFSTWVSRYINAYYAVRDGSYGADDPNCLYDSNGRQLPRNTFGQLGTDQERADAVRTYLRRHGGIMKVIVVDKPGINKPRPGRLAHKERILTFDCGLRGAGPRVSAVQHLTVDSSVGEGQWFRECKIGGSSRPFSTAGMQQVQPPPEVTIVKPLLGLRGQYQ
jgi:hypothetical protein